MEGLDWASLQQQSRHPGELHPTKKGDPDIPQVGLNSPNKNLTETWASSFLYNHHPSPWR